MTEVPHCSYQEHITKEDYGVNSDDDNRGESYELHEALVNDVTAQGREKERLFEEDIELKWEKGGSGLVFYTGK